MNIFCCLFIMYNLLKAKSYIKLIVQKLNYTWVEIIQYWGFGDWGLGGGGGGGGGRAAPPPPHTPKPQSPMFGIFYLIKNAFLTLILIIK
jgi:hypothetical protein